MNIQAPKENKVVKRGLRYAVVQYFTMLKRWGGKFIYLGQLTIFNFGFHIIVTWGLFKSYNYIKKLKIEMGPQTVKGGLIGNDIFA